jgi:uncharacterized membrane protein YoaK (UPF0700 family)
MTPTRQLVLGMVLTSASGFIDAVGFIELGGYFVSFMSGNTTQAGVALVQGAWDVVMLCGLLVLLFFTGSFTGAFIAVSDIRWGPAMVSGFVFCGAALTLALTLAGWPTTLTMLVLAATAGAQNAILPMRGAVRLGATFVTGALYTAGQDLAFALKGKAPGWRWAQHLAMWFALMSGATIGALLYGVLGIGALAAPMLVYALFTASHLWMARPA